MLDLDVVLQEFKLQKDKIEKAINLLEGLQQHGASPLPDLPVLPSPRKQRGRKHMGAEERLQVAARMKKYWAKRRKRQLQ